MLRPLDSHCLGYSIRIGGQEMGFGFIGIRQHIFQLVFGAFPAVDSGFGGKERIDGVSFRSFVAFKPIADVTEISR